MERGNEQANGSVGAPTGAAANGHKTTNKPRSRRHRRGRGGGGKSRGTPSNNTNVNGASADNHNNYNNKSNNEGDNKPRSRNRNRNRNRRRKKAKTQGEASEADVELTDAVAPVEQNNTVSNVSAPEPRNSNEEGLHVTTTEFSSLGLSAPTQRAIDEVLRFRYLTQVQKDTLGTIVEGKDVLARARTGTGKTMGFLLPNVEKMFAKGELTGISCLVIAPTRELATQIAVEGRALCRFHRFNVEVVLGGTNKGSEVSRLKKRTDILVATPGRLIDHFESTPGFVDKFNSLQSFVLDEADQLLDMGFRPALLKISNYLPPREKRQTLLFSATVPQSTFDFARKMLRSDFEYVDTVGESQEATNTQVMQQVILAPFPDHLAALHVVLQKHKEERPDDFKIIVFFPTAMSTKYSAQLLNQAKMETLEIHSRMSSSARTRVSQRFRDSSKVIIFSSDVSARGVDYPEVTLCVQVGLTTREQYIHRVGRTARAGKSGQAILVLSQFEQVVLNDLKDLPIIDVSDNVLESAEFAASQKIISNAVSSVQGTAELRKSAERAYGAWMGFYKAHISRLHWTKTTLVKKANELSLIMGLAEVPALPKRTVGKMGLRGTPGLRLQ